MAAIVIPRVLDRQPGAVKHGLIERVRLVNHQLNHDKRHSCWTFKSHDGATDRAATNICQSCI